MKTKTTGEPYYYRVGCAPPHHHHLRAATGYLVCRLFYSDNSSDLERKKKQREPVRHDSPRYQKKITSTAHKHWGACFVCATRVSCSATGMRVKEPYAATRVHVSKDKIEDLKRNPNKSRAERERIKSEEEEEEERSPKSDLRRRRRRQGFQPVTREHNVIDAFFLKKRKRCVNRHGETAALVPLLLRLSHGKQNISEERATIFKSSQASLNDRCFFISSSLFILFSLLRWEGKWMMRRSCRTQRYFLL